MHLSYYTIPVKLEDEENKYLLVHGYTGAIDIVDGSIWKELKDYSSESTLSLEVTQLLQKRGYLTTKSKDEEIEYVSKLANLFHQAQSKLHKSFGFIVSYDCNFRCLTVLKMRFHNMVLIGQSGHLRKNWWTKFTMLCFK